MLSRVTYGLGFRRGSQAACMHLRCVWGHDVAQPCSNASGPRLCLQPATASSNLHDFAAQVCSAGGTILILIEPGHTTSRAAKLKPVRSVLRNLPMLSAGGPPRPGMPPPGQFGPPGSRPPQGDCSQTAEMHLATCAVQLCCVNIPGHLHAPCPALHLLLWRPLPSPALPSTAHCHHAHESKGSQYLLKMSLTMCLQAALPPSCPGLASPLRACPRGQECRRQACHHQG